MYNPKCKHDEHYGLPQQCVWLKFNGSWPLKTEFSDTLSSRYFGLFYNCFSWFVICCVGITICFQTAFLIKNFGNIMLTTENCSTTFMGIMNFVRLLHFRLNQNNFRRIIQQFAHDIWIVKNSHPHLERDCAKKMLIFRIMTILLSCLITIYCIVPLIELMLITDTIDTMDKPFPYKMLFPFDAHHGWRYVFTYAFTSYAGICVVTTLFAEDSIFGFFITFTCAQFTLLHERIDNLTLDAWTQHSKKYPQMQTQRNNDNQETALLQYEYVKSLKEISKKHITLIEFVKRLDDFFSPILLVNLSISSLLICMVGFQLVTSKDMFIGDYIKFLVYILSSLSQLFILCWIGDLLIHKSTETADHLYGCNWEGKSGATIKTVRGGQVMKCVPADTIFCNNLNFMIMASQKPLKITAYKFLNISLQSFKTILSSSMSYFTLLQTMYDKQ